ncbi:hypothetical protein EW146_g2325 [Bondarzewia mesenterica]|uniref:Aminoglycoside phosphotransferase domain-containing protein n=1 Tax=Bondarzewia mesenterica TaxID=1095465 RepID=A0A4S4M772_9AGAM|nr:hypothetical protein EW146_g2325 [Bondarzewia mesenterica]
MSVQQPSDSDGLTDDEIIQLRKTAPKLDKSQRPMGGYSITHITPNTVMKPAQDFEEDPTEASEALALQLVFTETTIPVPRVRRVVKDQSYQYIVMDFIPGRQLSEIWPSLSFMAKIRISMTLRRYIRELRAIRSSHSTVPGPLSSRGPRICESPIFGPIQSDRGPFASYGKLSAFFNERNRMSSRGSPAELFDDASPLVFTHQDLNMRNLLLGEDGRLWLIDWAWAGFYPRWFEFVAMMRQAENEEIVSGRKEPLWDALIPFICNPYFRQEEWLDQISDALAYV